MTHHDLGVMVKTWNFTLEVNRDVDQHREFEHPMSCLALVDCGKSSVFPETIRALHPRFKPRMSAITINATSTGSIQTKGNPFLRQTVGKQSTTTTLPSLRNRASQPLIALTMVELIQLLMQDSRATTVSTTVTLKCWRRLIPAGSCRHARCAHQRVRFPQPI
jgi:hypothetical protein